MHSQGVSPPYGSPPRTGSTLQSRLTVHKPCQGDGRRGREGEGPVQLTCMTYCSGAWPWAVGAGWDRCGVDAVRPDSNRSWGRSPHCYLELRLPKSGVTRESVLRSFPHLRSGLCAGACHYPRDPRDPLQSEEEEGRFGNRVNCSRLLAVKKSFECTRRSNCPTAHTPSQCGAASSGGRTVPGALWYVRRPGLTDSHGPGE